MKVQKNIISFLINAIVLSAFVAVCFLVRKDDYDTPFYVSLGISAGAFLIFATASYMMPKKKEFVILGYAPVVIASVYFVVTALLNLLLILFRMGNLTVLLVVNIVLSVVFLVLLLMSFLANVDSIEQTIVHKNELRKHHSIKDSIIALSSKGGSFQINKKIESLCDAVMNAQIYTNKTDIAPIDALIINKVNRLRGLLDRADSPETKIIHAIDEIKGLITKRNSIIQQALH